MLFKSTSTEKLVRQMHMVVLQAWAGQTSKPSSQSRSLNETRCAAHDTRPGTAKYLQPSFRLHFLFRTNHHSRFETFCRVSLSSLSSNTFSSGLSVVDIPKSSLQWWEFWASTSPRRQPFLWNSSTLSKPNKFCTMMKRCVQRFSYNWDFNFVRYCTPANPHYW